MDINDLLSKYVAPCLVIIVFLIERYQQIKKARQAEAKKYDINKHFDREIKFLQEQLDDCLDSTRPKRPE